MIDAYGIEIELLLMDADQDRCLSGGPGHDASRPIDVGERKGLGQDRPRFRSNRDLRDDVEPPGAVSDVGEREGRPRTRRARRRGGIRYVRDAWSLAIVDPRGRRRGLPRAIAVQ